MCVLHINLIRSEGCQDWGGAKGGAGAKPGGLVPTALPGRASPSRGAPP